MTKASPNRVKKKSELKAKKAEDRRTRPQAGKSTGSEQGALGSSAPAANSVKPKVEFLDSKKEVKYREQIDDVVAASVAVNLALENAQKGYRQTQYEQAANVFAIAEALQTSAKKRVVFGQAFGTELPKEPEDFASILKWVMTTIEVLNAKTASVWLRAFKTLVAEKVKSPNVAAAIGSAGGFRVLADRQAKKNSSSKAAQSSAAETASEKSIENEEIDGEDFFDDDGKDLFGDDVETENSFEPVEQGPAKAGETVSKRKPAPLRIPINEVAERLFHLEVNERLNVDVRRNENSPDGEWEFELEAPANARDVDGCSLI